MVRDPRWGRCEETLGEDPYLTAVIATAFIKGLQGGGPGEGMDLKAVIAATAKHFAGHGFSEGGRNWAPVYLGPRELRDVFLLPFEAVVREAGVKAIMNAYHDIDGVPCAANRELLTGILREEWGFDGIVVSDYFSVDMLRTHHYTAVDKKEAARQAIEAGIDIEFPHVNCYGQPLLEAVRDGAVPEAILDEAVSRILHLKLELGLFERVYVEPGRASTLIETEENRKLARELGRKSIVLLKNEGNILPLKKDIKSIAVIGPNAANKRNILGDYSYIAISNVQHDFENLAGIKLVSILEGIKNKVSSKTEVKYALGCDILNTSTEGISEAVETARNADAAVVVVGDQVGMFCDGTSGENIDRADISLYGAQEELVRAVYETGTPVIVVLVNGKPPALKQIAEKIPAVVEAWNPGEEGGNAVADVLFGDCNPGGKLPVSLLNMVGQVPLNYSLKPISCKDYLDESMKPAFPFGHGLSYTQFTYCSLDISPLKTNPGGEVSISFEKEGIL